MSISEFSVILNDELFALFIDVDGLLLPGGRVCNYRLVNTTHKERSDWEYSLAMLNFILQIIKRI